MTAFWETVKVVIISLLIIIPIRAYVMQPFFVSGASMEPSFNTGDYLLIDQMSFRFREAARGEVIVFKFPDNPSEFYIKRIVGLPGETVEIRDGEVYIYNAEFPDGFALDESVYQHVGFTFGTITTELADNEYFVLGDNRSQSSDSRRWGPLEEDLIVGRVWVRALPVSKAKVF